MHIAASRQGDPILQGGGGKFAWTCRADNALSCALTEIDVDVHIPLDISIHFIPSRAKTHPCLDSPHQLAHGRPMSANLLDEFLSDPLAPPPGGQVSVEKPAIQKIRYTHDAMVDCLIQNPAISQNDLAKIFNYSVSWISQVITSDAFQARLAARRAEITDPILQASVEERFKGLVSRSLEILSEKLNKPAAEVPDNLALKALEISSKAAGYGARESSSKVEVNMDIHLTQMGEKMTQLLQRKRTAIEGQAEPPALEDPGV